MIIFIKFVKATNQSYSYGYLFTYYVIYNQRFITNETAIDKINSCPILIYLGI